MQSESYTDIFIIENMLRFAFHNYFIDNIGQNYFTEKIFPPYKSKYASNKLIDIVDIVKKRKKMSDFFFDQKNDVLYLWYLDLPILIELYDNYWEEHTNQLFKVKNKDQIIPFLENIKSPRNDIAHNRPINEENVNLIHTAKIILEKNCKKRYLKAIDILFNESNNAINEEVVSQLNSVKENINNLNVVKNTELLSQLISTFFIIRNEVYDNTIIIYLNKYNSIPKNKDFGQAAERFIESKQLINMIDHLIKLGENS